MGKDTTDDIATIRFDAGFTTTPLPQFPAPHVQNTAAYPSQFNAFAISNTPSVKSEAPLKEATLMKAVSFYENCSRIVLRAVEEFEAVGHEGSDTRFHCELLTTPGTRSNRFTFTIHTYSESGTFGIKHWVKYTPDRDNTLLSKLGKFRDESDFLAHTAQSFFIDLTHQVDLALGQPEPTASALVHVQP